MYKLLADFMDIVKFVSSRPICNDWSKSSWNNTLILHPSDIFLLSRYFKKVDDESLTPINFPVSPIFKSLNFNLGVNFINPAGFGIGSPCGSWVGKFKN